jgi:hypothetical protein
LIPERALSLDISTKTGWALIVSSDQGASLFDYGQISKIPMPETAYPGSYVDWAYLCFSKIEELIKYQRPNVLVIEETSKGSKDAHSQKILEWTHFLLAKFIKDANMKAVYLMSGQWRNLTGCVMTKEESERNKYVREYKKKNNTIRAYDQNGKLIGLIGKKHVNVRRANQIFGKSLKKPLRMVDEDAADSMLLGFAYHVRRTQES